MPNPQKYTNSGIYYFDLTPDEDVVLFLRRHPITNWSWALPSLLMFLFPLIIVGFYEPTTSSGLAYLVEELGWLLLFVWYLLTLAFSLEKFLVWYFNVYIVTNKRVIDIDVRGFLHRNISETPLSNVQDVTFQSSGIGATLFNYGDVFIQTAGANPEFEFRLVGEPDMVHDIITDHLKQYRVRRRHV